MSTLYKLKTSLTKLKVSLIPNKLESHNTSVCKSTLYRLKPYVLDCKLSPIAKKIEAQMCMISFQTCTQIFGIHNELIPVKR